MNFYQIILINYIKKKKELKMKSNIKLLKKQQNKKNNKMNKDK